MKTLPSPHIWRSLTPRFAYQRDRQGRAPASSFQTREDSRHSSLLTCKRLLQSCRNESLSCPKSTRERLAAPTYIRHSLSRVVVFLVHLRAEVVATITTAASAFTTQTVHTLRGLVARPWPMLPYCSLHHIGYKHHVQSGKSLQIDSFHPRKSLRDSPSPPSFVHRDRDYAS